MKIKVNPDNTKQKLTKPTTFIEKMREIGSTARKDYHRTVFGGKILIGLLALMTVYEWGPGNQTVTPIIATRAMDATTGITGSLITATVAGGFTLCQQLLSSWLTRKSVVNFPKTSDKAFSLMNSERNEESESRFKKFSELPKSKQVFYSFVIGSSFNVLREAAVSGDTKNIKQLRSVGRRSATITAGIVFVLAFGADVTDQLITLANENTSEGGAINLAASVGQYAMNILKSPITWVSLGVVLLTKDYWKTKMNSRNQSTET